MSVAVEQPEMSDVEYGLRSIASHVRQVQSEMMDIVANLNYRMVIHDAGKYSSQESGLVTGKRRLDNAEYMSDEYKAAMEEVAPAIKAHYRYADHHPEHYKRGISGMTLMAMLEMMADWKVASGGRDYTKCLTQNFERYEVPKDIARIIVSTALELEYIRPTDAQEFYKELEN